MDIDKIYPVIPLQSSNGCCILPHLSGRNSAVECYLAKVEVESSNLFARSIFFGFILL